jgi:hypothetical protein
MNVFPATTSTPAMRNGTVEPMATHGYLAAQALLVLRLATYIIIQTSVVLSPLPALCTAVTWLPLIIRNQK